MGSQSCDSRIVVWNVIRKGIRYACFAPTLLLTCCAAFAQVYPTVFAPSALPPAPPSPRVNGPALLAPAGDGTTVAGTVQAPNPLEGLGFGAGVALSFGQSRVNSAVAVGPTNIVRVQDNSGVSAGIVLESHYFFQPPATQILGSAQPITWGYGPFIAVDASMDSSVTTSSGIFAGISLGWMVGFRRISTLATPTNLPPGTQATQQADNHSWNFGVGLHINPKANVLGDGIVANMPLPAGEATSPIRLKSEPRYGVILLTSFGF